MWQEKLEVENECDQIQIALGCNSSYPGLLSGSSMVQCGVQSTQVRQQANQSVHLQVNHLPHVLIWNKLVNLSKLSFIHVLNGE